MFKAIIAVQIVIGTITLSIIGALGYLIYTIVTKPELVHEWIKAVIG